MGVLDDSSSDGSNSENSANKKAAPQNPQEASKDQQQMAAGRMTPFARMKLEQQQKLEELYQDFCVFAKDWLEPSGCVQKGMVVLYFRSNFGNHKYKYTTAAEDMDIEDAFERWNASEHGPKAEQNEFGLYVGVQINAQHDAKVKEQEALDRRKTQIKLIIADSKRSGVKPPLDVLKEAMELGVIAVPKATLESMKAVGARPRRVSMAAPPQPHPSSSSSSTRDKKKKSHSVSRLGKSLGDLDFQKSERKDRKKSPTRKESSSKKSSSSRSSSRLGKSMGDLRYRASPSPTREKKKSTSKSSSSSKRRSSSRLGKSMGDLDYKSDKESSSRKERKHKRSPSKDRKSSSRDKEKKRDKKDKEKSRLHKSMGNLDYKSDKERKSSKDKDRKRDKDKEKEKKSSSRDKEKKKKSSRRSSVA